MHPIPSPGLHRALRPFHHREYRYLMASTAISLFASGMRIVASVRVHSVGMRLGHNVPGRDSHTRSAVAALGRRLCPSPAVGNGRQGGSAVGRQEGVPDHPARTVEMSPAIHRNCIP